MRSEASDMRPCNRKGHQGGAVERQGPRSWRCVHKPRNARGHDWHHSWREAGDGFSHRTTGEQLHGHCQTMRVEACKLGSSAQDPTRAQTPPDPAANTYTVSRCALEALLPQPGQQPPPRFPARVPSPLWNTVCPGPPIAVAKQRLWCGSQQQPTNRGSNAQLSKSQPTAAAHPLCKPRGRERWEGARARGPFHTNSSLAAQQQTHTPHCPQKIFFLKG